MYILSGTNQILIIYTQIRDTYDAVRIHLSIFSLTVYTNFVGVYI